MGIMVYAPSGKHGHTRRHAARRLLRWIGHHSQQLYNMSLCKVWGILLEPESILFLGLP